MYNGKFRQTISIVIKCKEHDECLFINNIIKKQCEAWFFCVKYTEYKSVRKGPVLQREITIYQDAYAGDILIFKEAIRRICFHFEVFHDNSVKFIDRGTEPENDLRKMNK